MDTPAAASPSFPPTSSEVKRKPPCISPHCTLHPHGCYLPECKVRAPNRCGGCKAAFYCSREHQMADWRAHRPECKKFKKYRKKEKKQFEVDTIYSADNTWKLTPSGHFFWLCFNCDEWRDQGGESKAIWTCKICNTFRDFPLPR